jgi:predicted secreted protein
VEIKVGDILFCYKTTIIGIKKITRNCVFFTYINKENDNGFLSKDFFLKKVEDGSYELMGELEKQLFEVDT